MDRRLTLYERTCLALHTMICTACRAYRRQVRMIRRALRGDEQQTFDGVRSAESSRLSSEARRRIQSALEQHD